MRACLLFFILSVIFPFESFGQCPVANSCTPGNPPSGNEAFGMGILNVTINQGLINHTTPGITTTTGYVDYSCTIGATLSTGVTYPISIRTNSNVNENVRVWLDLNNDGIFNATTELIFSSNNNQFHNGSINIPVSATKGAPLRMRVSADNFSSPLPTPCSTPQYSQVEDYRITLIANTVAPVTNFSASNPVTCTSTVSFTDLSQNGPTSWQWNFGDPASGGNNVSSVQHSSHTFSAPGIYTITLIAANANGTDTLIKTNYINYHTNVPVAATCTPATANYCCNYGITEVNFGNGLMINTSANGVAGYENFTCSKLIRVAAGLSYPISLTTGPNSQDARIYIDYNNDGNLTGPNELVLTQLNKINPSGTITIPASAVLNTPLRMRIISDNTGGGFNSCSGIQSGQAEDYTMIIGPNILPVPQFTSTFSNTCDTIVTFTGQSTNAPTSWLWNFGDPASGALNTSTLQNPTHIYHNPGSYTVTLVATNANGPGTVVKNNYINVTKPCIVYCASKNHNNSAQWISKVIVGNLSNSSGPDPLGYGDYTNLSGTMTLGASNPFTVELGQNYYTMYITIWIDINKDGIFQASERFYNGWTNTNASGASSITDFIAIPNTAQSGFTRMRVIATPFYEFNNPCLSSMPQGGETEDYLVTLLPNMAALIGGFSADLNAICTGSVPFRDASVNGATSWLWNFGDPASGVKNTSTLQNPRHAYPTGTSASYTVSLVVCKGAQCDTITKPNFVTVASPCQTYCMPGTNQSPGPWISQVSVGGMSNTTTAEPGGYGNYTYQRANLVLGSTANPVSISAGGGMSSPVVRIWIDLNQDGTFNTNELVLDRPYFSAATGTIDIPVSARVGFTRMRVVLSYTSNFLSPCPLANGYVEVEDYTVNILPNTLPASAGFKPDMSTICSGSVKFQDASVNGPTSWFWDFGDPASGANNTSTLQNPVHVYPAGTAANYTVTQIVCKSGQCDTLTKPNLIRIAPPCLSYCPVIGGAGTNNYFRWISRVNIGTINNATLGEANGYGNYTYLSTDLMVGAPHPITVNVVNFNLYMYVFAWIDFNKDGVFSPNEQVFDKLTNMNPAGLIEAVGSITLPGNAMTGLTRMRIIMSPFSNQSNTCIMLSNDAEVEDYLVNIVPNPNPVTADFKPNMSGICQGNVQFLDASTNVPTSWQWNFGDPASGAANTSILQNPTHTYSATAPGSYDVTLIACKAGLCDTVVYSKAVNITVPCLTYCATNLNSNTNQWIANVTIGNINNTSGAETNAYGNFTYLNTASHGSMPQIPVSVSLGRSTGSNKYITVWVDFNRDGVFQLSEKVVNTQATLLNGNLVASGSFGVPLSAAVGPTRMRVIMQPYSNATNACPTNSPDSEIEDYTFIILQNPAPPVTNFSANSILACFGEMGFTDASLNSPASWQWNFGDPNSGTANTATVQNPTHIFSAPGLYTIRLITTNAFGSDTLTKVDYINYDPTSNACSIVAMPVAGTVTTNFFCYGTLYDNGGANGNYADNTNGTVVIAPPNAATVSLTFTQFAVDSPNDVLRIYDGPGTSSPLLGTYYTTSPWGNPIPNGGAPITSTGGAITVQFTSNSSLNYAGFQANWSCNLRVGVKENLNDRLFEVFPNPSTGLVNLKLNETKPSEYNLSVTNVLGQVILKKSIAFSGSQTEALDLSKFGKGVYFIRIENDKTTSQKKVVLH